MKTVIDNLQANNRESAKEFFNRKLKSLSIETQSNDNLFLFCSLINPYGVKTIEELVLKTYLLIDAYVEKGFIKCDEENIMELNFLVWRTLKHNYPLNYIKSYNFIHVKETHYYNVVIQMLESFLPEKNSIRNDKILTKMLTKNKV